MVSAKQIDFPLSQSIFSHRIFTKVEGTDDDVDEMQSKPKKKARVSSTKKRNKTRTSFGKSKKEKGTPSKRISDDGEEKKKMGEWFFYVNGSEGYADSVSQVSVLEGEEHLNDPLEYVQKVPSVVFEQKEEVFDAECISIFLSAELVDIGLVELYQTMRPNVLLLVRPWLSSSFRVDLNGKDTEDEHRRKLLAVSRNFKVRNPKTQKMDTFWCQPAFDKHMMTLTNVEKQQRSEGKQFQSFTKACLLVFDESIEFDFTVFPDGASSETGKIKPSSEVITKSGQSITRLRFLVPTSNYRTIRTKIADQQIDDTTDRLAAALNISDEDDAYDEGMSD